MAIIKKTLENLKTLDRIRNALKKVKLINCKRQAPNLGRTLRKNSFSSSNSDSGIKNCGKYFVCCQCIKESIENILKPLVKNFIISAQFSCESKNLIYVVIYQHIRLPELQQINVEGHIRTCAGGNLKIMPFFAIREDNKILRESYEIYFVEKFKPEANKRHK